MAYPSVTTGVWTEISNTRLDSLSNLVPATFGVDRLTTAWNGGCWNQDDQELALFLNSGHGDGPENGLLAFVKSTCSWQKKITWPGGLAYSPDYPVNPGEGVEPYSDGTPSGRHTYAHTCWASGFGTRGKYFTGPGSIWSGDGGVGGTPWTADPVNFPDPFTSLVQRADMITDTKTLGMITDYDPKTNRVYTMGGANRGGLLQSFDDATNTWTARGAQVSNGPGEDPACNGKIDPVGRKLWWIGPTARTGHPGNGAGMACIALDGAGSNAPLDVRLVSVGGSGDTSIQNFQGVGIIYDPIRRVFIAWGSGDFPNRIYIIDPATLRYNAGTGYYDVDCLVEDPISGTGPGISTTHGLYGRMGHDLEDDVLVIAEAYNKNVFLYRVQYRESRALPLPNMTWVAKDMPAGGGYKMQANRAVKHMHSLSDEARECVVFFGGDCPTSPSGNFDAQVDTYNVKTEAYSVLAPGVGMSPSLYQPSVPDNTVFLNDTTNDRYLMYDGYWAYHSVGADAAMDSLYGDGQHGIALSQEDGIAVLDPDSGHWSAGPAIQGYGRGTDDNSTGQGCFDPVDGRCYSTYGGSLQWFDIDTNQWGLITLSGITDAGNGKLHREHVRIDVTGRKLYILDRSLRKLAYVSIAAADYGTSGYVPTPDIPGANVNYDGGDKNWSMDFDDLNRCLLIPLTGEPDVTGHSTYRGYVYKANLYFVDSDTWVNVPITSDDFPGLGQGQPVLGAETVYDKAHNVFILHSGNGSSSPGGDEPIPRPTKFAVFRVAGGPITAPPESGTIVLGAASMPFTGKTMNVPDRISLGAASLPFTGQTLNIQEIIIMAWIPFDSFKLRQFNGNAIDFDTDTIKLLITTSTYTPVRATHDFRDDVTNEVSGTGYTAGGIAIGTVSLAVTSNTLKFDVPDITITQNASGFTTGRWLVLAKITGGASSTDPLIAYYDLTSDRGNVSGDLVLQTPDGIFTF